MALQLENLLTFPISGEINDSLSTNNSKLINKIWKEVNREAMERIDKNRALNVIYFKTGLKLNTEPRFLTSTMIAKVNQNKPRANNSTTRSKRKANNVYNARQQNPRKEEIKAATEASRLRTIAQNASKRSIKRCRKANRNFYHMIHHIRGTKYGKIVQNILNRQL